jgi:hypothetical protein
MAEHSGRPDDERRAWLWSQVRDLAAAEGVAVGVRHVCATAAAALHATDIVVYQVVDGARSEPVSVSGALGDRLSEAQITFGEGPAVDCLREEYPVLATDLASRGYAATWPVYAPFALSQGVAAIFAFPVMMGAIVVGCLEAHRAVPGALSDGQVVDGLLLADAVMMLLLRSDPLPLGADPFADAVEARWATVHQATGVVSVQLESDLATAFVRLRAHAYRTGARLADVAADVLARKLRFRPDSDVESDPSSDPEQG